MLKDKILKIIHENKLVNKGDRILLAVSGGIDSSVLLNIFCKLKKDLGIKLHAAHFNHGFRGKESDKDALFIKELCRKLAVPCTIVKMNIPKLLEKEKSVSVQDTARNLRYEFLMKTAIKYHCNRIAAGHNHEDQTETVLLHLFRGCGTRGLIGMQYIMEIANGITLIRPFLEISRKDIEAYILKNKITYREDSSNFFDYYRRNHIRHNLIPLIREKYNPDIDSSISKLCKILKDENDYLNKITGKYFSEIVKKENDKFIMSIDSLNRLHPAIRKRIIFDVLSELKGNINAVNYENIESIEKLSLNKTGKKINLSGDYTVMNEYGNLVFSKKIDDFPLYEFKIPVPCNTFLSQFNIKIKIALKKKFSKAYIENEKTIYFSIPDKPDNFIVRNRRHGDRFIPSGMKGSRKLKDFFIDMKIPVYERDKIPLLLYKNEILWVMGVRRSDKYKPAEKDKNIIEIKIEEIAFAT